MSARWWRFLPVLGPVLAAAPAMGQEAMFTAAATMPSPGVVIVRPQFTYLSFGANPDDGTSSTHRLEALTSVQIGVARALSFTLEVPVEFDRRKDSTTGAVDHDKGVEDLGLTFKYRFFKDDTGGLDTVRAAVFGGVHIPTGDDHDYSDGNISPHFGAVVTVVRGRHGFNQDIDVRINPGGGVSHNLGGGDGSSDAIRHNTAYLYRLSPEMYTAETRGSWYATVELNGIYETNGDYELRWSPGVMYEATGFAVEVMAQFPLYHHLRHRAELDFSIGVGIRLTF